MKISELFYSVQGEGKLMGVPSVFVRASGCNLRCSWCDTPYASWNPEGENLAPEEIVSRVSAYSAARHVVLTGGEPTIMPDYPALAALLKDRGYHITVETAGTVFQAAPIDLASISPKLANSTPWVREEGRFAAGHEKNRLNLAVVQQLIASTADFQLKFVVNDADDLHEIDRVLSKLTGWTGADVLLMPQGVDLQTLSERSAWLSELCKSRGFRFCPRLHVMLYGNKRGT